MMGVGTQWCNYRHSEHQPPIFPPHQHIPIPSTHQIHAYIGSIYWPIVPSCTPIGHDVASGSGDITISLSGASGVIYVGKVRPGTSIGLYVCLHVCWYLVLTSLFNQEPSSLLTATLYVSINSIGSISHTVQYHPVHGAVARGKVLRQGCDDVRKRRLVSKQNDIIDIIIILIVINLKWY